LILGLIGGFILNTLPILRLIGIQPDGSVA